MTDRPVLTPAQRRLVDALRTAARNAEKARADKAERTVAA